MVPQWVTVRRHSDQVLPRPSRPLPRSSEGTPPNTRTNKSPLLLPQTTSNSLRLRRLNHTTEPANGGLRLSLLVRGNPDSEGSGVSPLPVTGAPRLAGPGDRARQRSLRAAGSDLIAGLEAQAVSARRVGPITHILSKCGTGWTRGPGSSGRDSRWRPAVAARGSRLGGRLSHPDLTLRAQQRHGAAGRAAGQQWASAA